MYVNKLTTVGVLSRRFRVLIKPTTQMCSGCGLCRNLSAGVGFGVLTEPECFALQRTAGRDFCKLDSPRAHFSLSSYASNRESTVINALFSSTHEGQGHPSLSAGVEGI